MQFESVVTNSKLGFSDIAFLELNPQIAQLFKLSESGNINWKQFLDDFGNISHNFTKANLKADIDKLYNLGVGLANAGAENVLSKLLEKSDFNGLMTDNVITIANVVNNSYNYYKSLDGSIGSNLLSLIGGKPDVSRLFNIATYNLASWMTDYNRESMGQYYTQEWFITRNESGKETVCYYEPPFDGPSVQNSSEWVRFATSDANFQPTTAQYEQILKNSESYAGWSRSQVNQLNAANDGYTYRFVSDCLEIVLSKGTKQTYKAYAYTIKVVKSWTNSEQVYSSVFDSYSMDWDTFQKQLQVKLSEMNDNEDGVVYSLSCGDKRYYQATDEAKLSGCESVVISVNCADGTTLIEGNTQYKCNTCSGTLDAHTKECSMLTNIPDEDLSGADYAKKDAEYAQQIENNYTKITQLEAENKKLVQMWASNGNFDKSQIVQQINANTDEIARLKAENESLASKREELAKLQAESGDDDVATDDHYRIPAIMNDCQTAFELTWINSGYWSGYTFIRDASAPNINGTLKFQATLSVERQPSIVLGIKVHRAIIGIAWKLTAEYSDKQVVDIITFSDSKSDNDKAKVVNDHISQVAQDYPNCEIETEYLKSDAPEDDATTDTYHLLWSSDRLEIARQIDVRITQIYADLVSLEKMMHYKRSIVDVLKDAAPTLNDTQGKKLTITEEAHERWMKSAKYLGKEGGAE
jgi:hypothetical protein